MTEPSAESWAKRSWFMQRTIMYPYRVRLGFVMLAVAVFVALTFEVVLIDRVDDKDNATRCAVVGVVYHLAVSAEVTANATLDSSTASLQQKQAAQGALVQLTATYATTVETLGHPRGLVCPDRLPTRP